MALLDDVLFSLRITTNTNTNLNQEITRYINAARLDLIHTTDIEDFNVEAADDLLKDAIILYCEYMYERDPSRKDAYKKCYDDLKTKLLLSHNYSSLGARADA